MKEYLDHIQGLIDKYKPRLEEILGERIGDIKAISHKNQFEDLIDSTEKMCNRKLEFSPFELLAVYIKFKLHTATTIIATIPFKDRIYVKDGIIDIICSTTERNKMSVVHELAHIASFPYAIWEKRKEKTFNPLLEGFAEFVRLKYPSIYSKDGDLQDYIKREKEEIKRKVTKKHMKDKAINPYQEGYVFWSHVLDKIGKQNWRFVFANPPETEDEIRQPHLYLSRVAKDNLLNEEFV